MALKEEVLKANEVLADLKPEQIKAIETLSVNDETQVINTKMGETYGLIDGIVKEVTGLEKQGDKKSTEFMKETLLSLKTKAAGSADFEKTISEKEATIATLKKQIADGNTDEALKKQLSDAQQALETTKDVLKTKEEEFEKERSGFKTKLSGLKVGSVLENATAGLKFKADYPESAQKILLSNAKATLTTKFTPDFVEVDGVETLVFRDEKGTIQLNQANGLKPYTAKELAVEQLKDVLDLGKKTPGTGTKKPGDNGNDTPEIIDISTAKTQAEASDIIIDYLMKKGIPRGTDKFTEQQDKLWKDNDISKLPMR